MNKKTKYLCIKDLEMIDGRIAFHEGEIYEAIGNEFCSEINPGIFDHELFNSTINKHFKEQNKEKDLLTNIFEYVSGGYLNDGEYSDQKIRKGQKYAMEDIVERFFKTESEQAKAKTTALEILKKFEINQEVLEHLNNLTK